MDDRPTGETADLADPVDPEVRDPFESGVSRRRLLGASAVAGATAATAGCTSGPGGGADSAPTVFVFNTGDKTVSVIDAASDELVTTTYLGSTASFPSNQYAPRLVDSEEDVLWMNVSSGVKAVNAKTLSEEAAFDTGSKANWLELTPDGSHLVVSAREPAHTQYRLDADPSSDTFGEVTAELDRSGEVDNEQGGPGPCDATSGPDGAYSFVPDLYSDTVTVLDVESFEIAAQVGVEPEVSGADSVGPLMGTASWDGQYFTVENVEGEDGTESIWDVSDPENPEELHRVTTDDGLGVKPLTSEIGPDNEIAYVFTPGTNDVSVIDLASGSVEDRLDLGGSAFVGTWDPDRTKLYVPVQSTDTVKVIDHANREIVSSLEVGSKPYGATAGTVRPQTDSSGKLLAAAASVGLTVGGVETTYCEGSCHCGAMEHTTDVFDV